MSCDDIAIPALLRFFDAVSSPPVYQEGEASRSHPT
jgi:hypothetical protein